MRVRGLGFVEFRSRMAWSSGKDEDVGTVPELTALLQDILLEERDLDCSDELLTAAVVYTSDEAQVAQGARHTHSPGRGAERVHPGPLERGAFGAGGEAALAARGRWRDRHSR